MFSHLVYLFSSWLINLQCQKSRYPSRFPLKMLQYSAEHGHARAMSHLGCMLYQSGACKAEKRSGIEYVRRAAKRDVSEAQYVLGNAYLTDDVFHQKNKQLALHWLALAADKGHTQASRKLQAISRQTPSDSTHSPHASDRNQSERTRESLESV